jgi:hypothetical protein
VVSLLALVVLYVGLETVLTLTLSATGRLSMSLWMLLHVLIFAVIPGLVGLAAWHGLTHDLRGRIAERL